MNTPDLRSPFVERVISLLPRGHEEAMKQAFYNVAAICLFIMMAGAAMAVYFILEPFVKPLLWAILVGSVLHPLKRRSTVSACNWLSQMKENNTLLVFGFLFVPLQAVNKGTEWMGTALFSHIKLLFSLTLGFHLVHIIKQHCSLSDVVYLYENIVSFCQHLSFSIDILLLQPIPASFIAGFIGIFITLMSQKRLDISVTLLWIGALVLVLISLGSWSIIVIAPLLFLVLVAFAIDWGWLLSDYPDSSGVNGEPLEGDEVAVDVSTPKFSNGLARLMKSHILTSALSSLATPAVTDHSKMLETSSSNRYILRAFWACLAVQFWRHMWLFHFVPIPLVYFMIKAWGSYFNLWGFLNFQKSKLINSICKSFYDHKNQIFPKPLQSMYKVD